MTESRDEPRVVLNVSGSTIRHMGGSADKVILRDLSAHGFRTEWPHILQKGDRVWLRIPGFEALPATVAWDVNYTIGCKFDTPLHTAVLARIIELLKDNKHND